MHYKRLVYSLLQYTYMIRAILVTCYLVLALPLYSFAQTTSDLIGSGPSLTISPRFPEPNQTMVVSLDDYASNLAGNTVRWFVDGQELIDQINQRQVTITAGPEGEDQLIRALIIPEQGIPLEVDYTVRPYYLDLIIEPQTRVPAHYTGRALPSIGSQVNVTALVSADTPASELAYTWQVNEIVLFRGAVRGQNRVTFTMPQGSAIVTVSVSDGERELASRSIELVNNEPLLHFYATNPLYGVSQLAIQERFILLGNSATIRAEPYYLDLTTYNNPDLLEWKTQGTSGMSRTTNPYELLLNRTNLGTVGFHVRNLTQVLQGAQGNFSVE